MEMKPAFRAVASKPETEQTLGASTAYSEAMAKAGVLAGANRLRPTTAAGTVRVSNGKSKVLDGPYADTKEELGGYFMIELPISTPRWHGRRAAQEPAMVPSRSVRSGKCRPSMPQEDDGRARCAAKTAARQSYGKLVAFLAARTRDLAGAGCLVRSLRCRSHRLAGKRYPEKAECVADDGGKAQNDRCREAARTP
jgi:hypothetical protein